MCVTIALQSHLFLPVMRVCLCYPKSCFLACFLRTKRFAPTFLLARSCVCASIHPSTFGRPRNRTKTTEEGHDNDCATIVTLC